MDKEMEELNATARKLEAEGHHEQAFQALFDSLILSPSKSSAAEIIQKGNQLALKSANSHNYEVAQRVLDKVNKSCDMVEGPAAVPLRALTLGNLGFLQFKQGHNQAALRSLRAAATMEEEHSGHPAPSTLVNLCHVLHHVGKYAEAITNARKACELLEGLNSPMRVSVHHILAMSLEAHGSKSSLAQAGAAYHVAQDLGRSILDAGHPILAGIDASWKAFMARVNQTPRSKPLGGYDTIPAIAFQSSLSPSSYSGQSVHKGLQPSPPRSPQVGSFHPPNEYAARMQATAIKRYNQAERERLSIEKARRLYEMEKIKRAKKEKEDEEKRQAEAQRITYEKMVEALRIEEAQRYMQATLRIQVVFRGYLVRDLLLKWVRCATKVQSVFRSYLCRRNLRLEVENKALEASALAKKLNFFKTIVKIQSWFRMLKGVAYGNLLKRARMVKRIHSAYVIQRFFRHHRLRRQMEALREEERVQHSMHKHLRSINRAALRIQTSFRVFVARKLLKFLKVKQQLQNKAVPVVQRLVRGFLARRRVKRDRSKLLKRNALRKLHISSAVTCQRYIRGFLARRRTKRMWLKKVKVMNTQQAQRAIIRIQCAWRCHVARKTFLEKQLIKHKHVLRVIIVQRLLRARGSSKLSARKSLIWRMHRSARIIQKCRFRQLQRRRYEDVAKYHAAARAKEKYAMKRTAAAMKLQSWARGNSDRKKARLLRTLHNAKVAKIVKIQCLWRMYVAKKELRLLQRIEKRVLLDEIMTKKRHQASITVQCMYRCWKAYREASEKRVRWFASEKIQKCFRMYSAKKRLCELQDAKHQKVRTAAAVRIQNTVRLFIRRMRIYRIRKFYIMRRAEKALLQRKKESAITIQAVWRGHHARKLFTVEHARFLAHTSDAMKMQTVFRVFLFRKRLMNHMHQKTERIKQQHRAAVKIQSTWRMAVTIEYVSKLRRERAHKTAAVVKIQTTQRKCAAKDEYYRLKLEREARERANILRDEKWMRSLTLLQRFAHFARSRQIIVHAHRVLHETVTTTLQKRYHARIYRAASLIQGLYRGFVERIYVRGVRREIAEKRRLAAEREALRQKMTLKIQCAWRVFVAVRRAKSIRKANFDAIEAARAEAERTADPAELVSGLFLSMEAQTRRHVISEQRFRHKRNHTAATNIQRVVKGHQTRGTTQRLLLESKRVDAAIAVQRWYRTCSRARFEKKWKVLSNAAYRIQMLWRRFIVRRELKERITVRMDEEAQRVAKEETRDQAASRIANAWRCVLAVRETNLRRLAREEKRQQTKKNESIRLVQNEFRLSEGRRNSRGKLK